VVAALAAVVGAPGCSDDCGFDGAPASGLLVTADAARLDFGNLTSLAGNDCPDPDAPAGVVSLSIEGAQVGGPGLITLCVPRPDQLRAGMRAIGANLPNATADVRIIDLRGAADDCTFRFASAEPVTGHATATGVCDDGTDPAGFAIAIDAMVKMTRVCGANEDVVMAGFRGRVRVTPRAE
jgi:hypothetical protein